MEKAFIVIALCFNIYKIFFDTKKFFDFIPFFSLLALKVYNSYRYGHFPVTGLFETLSFLAFSIMLINFFFKETNKKYFFLSNILITIILSFCLMAPTNKSPFTPDALNTFLFPLHVAFSFLSYAFFSLAFIGVLSRCNEDKIFNLNYLGFLTFTIGLWTGGIWAFKAWGAYFLYSIKEIFSFTLWVYYAAIIHLKFIKEREKLLKITTIIGFILVVFTYIGIGIFMKNTHSL